MEEPEDVINTVVIVPQELSVALSLSSGGLFIEPQYFLLLILSPLALFNQVEQGLATNAPSNSSLRGARSVARRTPVHRAV
jgi:hypothetical protein